MTTYSVDRIHRVDRIITGAYTGPLAKRHCAALRHVDGDDVTECTGRVQTELVRTTCGSMCRIWTDDTDDYELQRFIGSR